MPCFWCGTESDRHGPLCLRYNGPYLGPAERHAILEPGSGNPDDPFRVRVYLGPLPAEVRRKLAERRSYF